MNPLDAAAIAIVCLWFVGLLLMTWLFFFYEHHGDSYPLRILRARSNPRLVRASALMISLTSRREIPTPKIDPVLSA